MRTSILSVGTTGTIELTEDEFDYFADRILTGEEVVPDGEHGLLDVRAIEANYEAAEAGERIEL